MAGGPARPDGLDVGFYVRPTVVAGAEPGSRIAQQEVFGPVLTVLPYADEEDALQIANDSTYGLGGAVWSADQDRATAFARRLQTGQIDINGGTFNPLAPFGGQKCSGIGREFGPYGVREFLRTKSLQF